MRVCVLGSGSKGNCTLIESGRTALVIDAGFSGVEIRRRLQAIDRQADGITSILVTHEHHDHISGVGVLSRQLGVPVHANQATHQAAEARVGKLFKRNEFNTGEKFEVGDLQVHPFAVSHDTADPVGFVVSNGTSSIGYCTDTGKITTLIEHHLKRCQVLILESNHDPQMLREGPYPPRLQQRVRSNQGHLANEEAGLFLRKLSGGILSHVVLAHLSETNNLPELALKTVRKSLGEASGCIDIVPAAQATPCSVIELP